MVVWCVARNHRAAQPIIQQTQSINQSINLPIYQSTKKYSLTINQKPQIYQNQPRNKIYQSTNLQVTELVRRAEEAQAEARAARARATDVERASERACEELRARLGRAEQQARQLQQARLEAANAAGAQGERAREAGMLQARREEELQSRCGMHERTRKHTNARIQA